MTTPEELRARVAEVVMGWELGEHPRAVAGHRRWWYWYETLPGNLRVRNCLRCQKWNPLESWADAGRVIERMQKLGWDIDMVCLGANTAFPNYDVHFTRTDANGFRESTVGYADDPDPKEAISLAALRALGVEVE